MIKHKQKIDLVTDIKPRRSKRIRTNHAKLASSTIWKPSSQPSHLVVNNHPMSLPTYIMAEPSHGLKEIGNDSLHDNMKVVKITSNNNNYIAYVDIINHILSPNSSSRDWEVQKIENHIVKQGQTWIKVLWKTGYKSWVKLEDLKCDDPLNLVHYAQNNKLSHLEDWKWTDDFNQNIKLFKVMSQNIHQASRNTYKFGVGYQKLPNKLSNLIKRMELHYGKKPLKRKSRKSMIIKLSKYLTIPKHSHLAINGFHTI